MNKDMINIDDFVREKLGGHTEKEDPAAWLRMKALLDKEMPEKAVPFVFRWGKPAAMLGAALLIGALCVGGYKLSAIREKSVATPTSTEQTTAIKTNANSNTNKTNTNNENANNENSFQAPESLSSNSTTSPDGNNTAATTNPVAERNAANPGSSSIAETQSASEPGSNAYTGHKQDQAPGNRNGVNAGNTKARHTAAASSVTAQPGHNNHATASGKQSSRHPGNTKAGNVLAANVKAGHTNNTSSHDAALAVDKNTNNQPASGQHQQTAKAKKSSGTAKSTVFNSASSAANKTKQVIAANKEKSRGHATTKPGSGEENRDLAKNKETANRKDAAPANSEELKDSISAISVVTRESTSRGGYPKKITRITDTIAITKVPVAQPKTINNTIVSTVQPSKKTIKQVAAESRKANKLASKNAAESQKNVFAAANKAELKENNDKTATSTRETQSVVRLKKEKGGFSQWLQNLNLPEAMASAKQDFNSAQFYWGFTAGGNYSLPNGSGSFQGVQFGPTGELVFNKHWSLFGAIKYFNRSGSKKVVNDNFSSQIADQDSTQGANWFFTARTDSTNRYFNFSTVHSFEMPITLRYTIRKFYLMTGINLAYYLPVNVEKVEREYNNMNVHVVTTNSTKPILNSTSPGLAISDFGSRFAVGYVIGAGYQITPAWQADLRVTNLLWDNAKGEGAQKLSRDFYRLPSVQLSFGYQFNRIRNRATFGPNSAP